MSKYFSEQKSLGRRVKVELDLSNYATKADFKNATGVDISKLAKKVDLANLKSNIVKLDIDKLKNVATNLSNLKSKVDKLATDKLVPLPVDLSKPSGIVKNFVVKKVAYNAKIKDIEDKIPDITNLATTTALNTKTNDVKNKIPSIRNLVQKTDYNTKITEIENKTTTDHEHDKYITTQEFNKLTLENFTARLKQANLASKSDVANFVKNTDFDDKLNI